MQIINISEIRNPKSEILFDVIILGGGVAGLSTALWCDELGLSALVLETGTELGGQLLRVHNEIKNYPGREAKNGRELRDAFLEQIAKRRFDLLLAAQIDEIDLAAKEVFLEDGARVRARAVVVATGVRRRRLNVEGEAEFTKRGILESGKKDSATVAGKDVLVIGGGDAAFENALILAETARRVTLAHRGKTFRAREEFTSQVEKHPRIEVLTETIVRRLAGDARLESVELEHSSTGETTVLEVDALLVRIGVAPNTEIFRGQLELDEKRYIRVGGDCGTNLDGVWAVGDVANPSAPTISSAAGMGATAAKRAFSWLNSL